MSEEKRLSYLDQLEKCLILSEADDSEEKGRMCLLQDIMANLAAVVTPSANFTLFCPCDEAIRGRPTIQLQNHLDLPGDIPPTPAAVVDEKQKEVAEARLKKKVRSADNAFA